MAMSEMYHQCTPAEQLKIDKIYEQLRPMGERMAELHKYTRPAGKATVSWEQAKAFEDEYVDLEEKSAKLSAQVRKIYRKYAKFIQEVTHEIPGGRETKIGKQKGASNCSTSISSVQLASLAVWRCYMLLVVYIIMVVSTAILEITGGES